MSEKISLTYTIKHPYGDKSDLQLNIQNTGIDLGNKEHQEKLKVIITTIAPLFYAIAEGIELKNVKF